MEKIISLYLLVSLYVQIGNVYKIYEGQVASSPSTFKNIGTPKNSKIVTQLVMYDNMSFKKKEFTKTKYKGKSIILSCNLTSGGWRIKNDTLELHNEFHFVERYKVVRKKLYMIGIDKKLSQKSKLKEKKITVLECVE